MTFQGIGYLQAGSFSTIALERTLINGKRRACLMDYTHLRCTNYHPPMKLRQDNVFSHVCLSTAKGRRSLYRFNLDLTPLPFYSSRHVCSNLFTSSWQLYYGSYEMHYFLGPLREFTIERDFKREVVPWIVLT